MIDYWELDKNLIKDYHSCLNIIDQVKCHLESFSESDKDILDSILNDILSERLEEYRRIVLRSLVYNTFEYITFLAEDFCSKSDGKLIDYLNSESVSNKIKYNSDDEFANLRSLCTFINLKDFGFIQDGSSYVKGQIEFEDKFKSDGNTILNVPSLNVISSYSNSNKDFIQALYRTLSDLKNSIRLSPFPMKETTVQNLVKLISDGFETHKAHLKHITYLKSYIPKENKEFWDTLNTAKFDLKEFCTWDFLLRENFDW